MTTTTLSTRVFGERYAVRADWSRAESQIQSLNADNEWDYTGRQVADYRHWPKEALRDNIMASCIDCTDDDLLKIEEALDDAEEE